MDKTPLQHVISVICDAVSVLPPVDQARALEAARFALGLNLTVVPSECAAKAPRPRSSPVVVEDDEPILLPPPAPPTPTLPMVQIEMESGRPMVVNGGSGRGGRAMVIVTPMSRRPPLRALAPPTVAPSPTRGFVRSSSRWAR